MGLVYLIGAAWSEDLGPALMTAGFLVFWLWRRQRSAMLSTVASPRLACGR